MEYKWLYLDVNSFFASCEQQENPILQNKPIAVVPMKADTTFCLAASYEAKKYGVKTGVRVSDAKKMCPGLILVQARHHVYVHYHHKLIEAVDKVLPVHRVCSIDEISCELTGSQKSFFKASQLATKIKSTLKSDLGEFITVSIGLGPNQLLAKIAADMKKPNGFSHISLEDLPEKLWTLHLRDIPGIGERMEKRLHGRNIFQVKELLNLNEFDFTSIWGGDHGKILNKLLRGQDVTGVSYFQNHEIPKSIGHEHVLPPDFRNIPDAKGIAQRLLSKAATRLRKHNLLAKKLRLGILCKNHFQIEEFVKFHGTDNTSDLLTQLLVLFSKLKNFDPLKISLTLSDLEPKNYQQLSLFDNPKKFNLFQVVDRLNEKYGRDTVFVGSIKNYLQSGSTRIAFSRIPELSEIED